MKEIIVDSKVHGRKVIMVDDEDYDELIQFKWYVSKGKAGVFYARRCTPSENGRTGDKIRMHRQIVGVTETKVMVDHRDGNGLNNVRSNLRVATHQQNNFNKRAMGGESKYMGVWRDKRRDVWRAGLSINNKNNWLGDYKNELHAAYAYNWAAKAIRGDFANLNDLSNVF